MGRACGPSDFSSKIDFSIFRKYFFEKFSGFFDDFLLSSEKRFAEVSARSEHFLEKKGVADSGRHGRGRAKYPSKFS